jgi:hypothetical protein
MKCLMVELFLWQLILRHYSTTTSAGHSYFMEMLRSRCSEVPERKGGDIEWMLGMVITQNIDAGSVRVDYYCRRTSKQTTDFFTKPLYYKKSF